MTLPETSRQGISLSMHINLIYILECDDITVAVIPVNFGG